MSSGGGSADGGEVLEPASSRTSYVGASCGSQRMSRSFGRGDASESFTADVRVRRLGFSGSSGDSGGCGGAPASRLGVSSAASRLSSPDAVGTEDEERLERRGVATDAGSLRG